MNEGAFTKMDVTVTRTALLSFTSLNWKTHPGELNYHCVEAREVKDIPVVEMESIAQSKEDRTVNSGSPISILLFLAPVVSRASIPTLQLFLIVVHCGSCHNPEREHSHSV